MDTGMTCLLCKHFHTCPHKVQERDCDGWCIRYPQWIHKNGNTIKCGEFKNINAVKRNAKKLLESPEFQEFYEAYPKKTARDHANKAFMAVGEHNWPLIIKRATSFAQAVVSEGKDMQYVKHPATWLNSGSWKDKAEVKGDSKACIVCSAPYADGHKYAFVNGKIVKDKYKCKKCRK